MDVRGVDRILEKTYGMADTALSAGAKTIEGIVRDARVSDHAKRQLIPLFRREAAHRAETYANLGLAVCRVLESETDDTAARARLDFYRAGFENIQRRAQTELEKFADGRAVELS
jgi:hypothetical protein